MEHDGHDIGIVPDIYQLIVGVAVVGIDWR